MSKLEKNEINAIEKANTIHIQILSINKKQLIN